MRNQTNQPHARRWIVVNPGSHPAPKWIASSFQTRSVLTSYWTSAQYSPQGADRWMRFLPVSAIAQLGARRLPDNIPWRKLKRRGVLLDLLSTVFKRVGKPDIERRLLHLRSRKLAQAAVRQATKTRGHLDTWLLFPSNTHSDISALAASAGVPYALYTPLPYTPFSESILEDEARTNPVWAAHLHFRAGDPLAGDRSAVEETKQASAVVVNSSFTGQSFATVAKSGATLVAPLAINLSAVQEQHLEGSALRLKRRTSQSPLKLIYAGQISQRKGLSYLFEAMQLIKDEAELELTLVGSDTTNMSTELRAAYPDVNARFVGSLPQAKLWSEMSQHHLFVFPTLLDGFGNVLLEAAAVGLPILATDRCGAADTGLIPDAGRIVPAADSKSLSETIKSIARDEDLRQQMAQAAVTLSARGRSWVDYGEEVSRELQLLKASR